MLFEVRPTGELRKMQLDSHPHCALFEQRIVPGPAGGEGEGGSVVVAVRYHGPLPPDGDGSSADSEEEGGKEEELSVPLEPDVAPLAKIDVDLHGSPTAAYRMGEAYDAWFSRRFGFPTVMVYIGDGRRAVLGKTLLPPKPDDADEVEAARPTTGWLSSLASYITTGAPPLASDARTKPWLTFTDVAPLLVTSERSLHDVCERLLDGQAVSMYKFRPNIVVDGEGEEPWAEDFWAELAISPGRDDTMEQGKKKHTLLLTGNCARCTSLNVDYQTGKPAAGEPGTLLKKLMKDRRVDPGTKWSPIFGRYAFLGGGHDSEGFTISVGDGVEVTRRNAERSVWDWPGL